MGDKWVVFFPALNGILSHETNRWGRLISKPQMTISMEFYDYRCAGSFYLDPGRPWNVSDIHMGFIRVVSTLFLPSYKYKLRPTSSHPSSLELDHDACSFKTSRAKPKERIVEVTSLYISSAAICTCNKKKKKKKEKKNPEKKIRQKPRWCYLDAPIEDSSLFGSFPPLWFRALYLEQQHAPRVPTLSPWTNIYMNWSKGGH